MSQIFKIDLHSHSQFSDGALPPCTLIDFMQGLKVETLALTDHDTTKGIFEAKERAKQKNIKFIPGVEITVSWQSKSIHLIGLNFDENSKNLQKLLHQNQKFRQQRAVLLNKKLESLNIFGALDYILAYIKPHVIGRLHFAKFLTEFGHVKDYQKAFSKYLSFEDKASYTENWISLSQGVQAIREANGLTVIAHPLRYGLSDSELESLLFDFKRLGGDGLEILSAHTTYDKGIYLTNLAEKFQLLASIGSDFHEPQGKYVLSEIENWLDLDKLKLIWSKWE